MKGEPQLGRAGTTSSLVLGIETSCDETAAAVVREGREVLSNVVASQIATHSAYGGVVPEIASREHLRQIAPVVREALQQAGVSLADICAIAVTEGPGLAGALFVGIAYAKALAFAAGKPLLAVNHLEGHIYSALMRHQSAKKAGKKLLALVVSGGHTHLYIASNPAGPREAAWHYEMVGRTVDDAAGEAFDKAARLLGLGYPGGPWIAALAERGDPAAVRFSFAQVKAKGQGEANAATPAVLFSYSGIKTAVARTMELRGMKAAAERRREVLVREPNSAPDALLALCEPAALDLAASFQQAMVEDLVRKTLRAAQIQNATDIVVTGGVAANVRLRRRFSEEAAKSGLTVEFPVSGLSTDNAAMIAAAAWPKFLQSQFAPPELTAQPSLRL